MEEILFLKGTKTSRLQHVDNGRTVKKKTSTAELSVRDGHKSVEQPSKSDLFPWHIWPFWDNEGGRIDFHGAKNPSKSPYHTWQDTKLGKQWAILLPWGNLLSVLSNFLEWWVAKKKISILFCVIREAFDPFANPFNNKFFILILTSPPNVLHSLCYWTAYNVTCVLHQKILTAFHKRVSPTLALYRTEL